MARARRHRGDRRDGVADGRGPVIRLIGLLLVLGLVPLALLASTSTGLADAAVRHEVHARLRTTSAAGAVFLEREMASVAELVQSYADRPNLVGALVDGDPARFDATAVDIHLTQLAQVRPGVISGAFLTDAGGRLTNAWPPTPEIVGVDFSFRDWYRGVTAAGRPYVSEAYETALAGHPLVVAAAALVRAPTVGGQPGEVLGIVAATYRLAAVEAFANQMAGAQRVGLTVTDGRGTVLSAPGPRRPGLVTAADDPLVAAALRGRSGTKTVGSGGRSVVGAYAPVPGIGWTITATVPARAAFAGVHRLRSTVLQITAVLALVLLTGLALLARSQARRVRAERTLRASKERTRSILEASIDAFISMDGHGRISAWDARAEAILGWTEAEALGRPLAAVVPPDLQQGDGEEVAAALAGDTPVPDHPIEVTALDKDGLRLPVELALSAVEMDGGRTFHAFVRDIRDRKRAAETTARLAAIVDSSEDAIISKALDGTILSWNGAAEHLYGYTAEEVVGRSISVVVPPDRGHEVGELLARVASQEAIGHYDTVRVRKDGNAVEVSLAVSPIRDGDGNIVAASTIARDVSAHKRAEADLATARDQAMEASRLKSEFLANMSHEIRTPMNGVLGMMALLLDTPLAPEQRDYAETARRSGEALLTLINDILDFSKVEAGKLEFEHIDFDLRSVVEDAAEILAAPAQAKELELACLVPPGLPTALRGDPGRLRQVLTNLVGNAVKFTDEGEVVVRVGLIEEGDEDATLRFEVADTGAGLEPGDRDRLFEAFSQADSSTTRRHGGTGLGLAISRRLVELMDGAIGVESEPGRGSTFWFTARLEKGSEEAIARLPGPREDLAGLRVLVVDDNATNRAVLEQMLAAWSMRPETAEGGREALELLRAAARRSEPFDVAVLDLNMPGMDGLEVARAMADDPSIAAVRTVLLTSSAQLGEARRASEAGIGGYLTKPVRQSQLYDCLATVVAHDSSPAPLVTRHRLVEARELARPRLLVVEDNPINQKVATGTLERMGFRVDVADDGAEGVRAVADGSYAAVLMDCQMPGMDGYEATAEIRRREAGRRPTPIIAMTAAAMEGDRERCLAAGMDDYLSKPLRREELADVLSRWVGREQRPSAEPPPPAATSSVQDDGVLDGETVTGLRALGERAGFDLVGELLELFARDTPLRLARLRRAILEDDAEGTAEAVHTLKGSVANLGATGMLLRCRRLEDLARSGDLGGAADLVAGLEEEYERVTARLGATFATGATVPTAT